MLCQQTKLKLKLLRIRLKTSTRVSQKPPWVISHRCWLVFVLLSHLCSSQVFQYVYVNYSSFSRMNNIIIYIWIINYPTKHVTNEIFVFFRCVSRKRTFLSCAHFKCKKSEIYTNADAPGDPSQYQELTITKEKNPNSYLNTTIHQ